MGQEESRFASVEETSVIRVQRAVIMATEIPISTNGINSKHSGFPRSRFEELPPADFLCKMCSEVVKKPVECSDCGALYCFICSIADHRRTREAMYCISCLKISKHRQLSPVLKRIIGNLRIRCKYPECSSVIPLKYAKEHERKCLMKKVKCSNTPRCNTKGLLKDFIRLDFDCSLWYAILGKICYVCSEKCKSFIEFRRLISKEDKKKALDYYKNIILQNQNK